MRCCKPFGIVFRDGQIRKVMILSHSLPLSGRNDENSHNLPQFSERR